MFIWVPFSSTHPPLVDGHLALGSRDTIAHRPRGRRKEYQAHSQGPARMSTVAVHHGGSPMCFAEDSTPPVAPISGAAVDTTLVTLTAADGNQFAAYEARGDGSGRDAGLSPPDRP